MRATAMTGLSTILAAAGLILSLTLAAQAQSTDRHGRQVADGKSGAFVDVTPTHKDGSSGIKRRRWKR